MAANNKNWGPTVGFLDILALIFITLKLTGVITWSWVWVLSPLWIPIAIIFVSLIIVILVTPIKREKKVANKSTDFRRR